MASSHEPRKQEQARPPVRFSPTDLLFGTAVFLGALLTFLLELLVAKMLLPLLGGTPSVWNTCVLFFQAMLLAGYGYSHFLGSRTSWRRWIPVHVLLMAMVVIFLPVDIGANRAPDADVPPVVWQLGLLLAAAGLPFLAVSTTTPLIQRWLAGSGRGSGGDPYHLYAASNLGSLVALLAYPLAVEPLFDVARTSRLWTAGYVALLVLLAACAVVTFRAKHEKEDAPLGGNSTGPQAGGSPRRWLALAFVPSSLTLSVTTHVSTNVASAPMLWILPLALYLMTYILAFARRPWFRVAALERFMPLVALLLAIVLVAEGLEPPPWLLFPLHLGGLFVISLACHGQMAELRPPASRLTEYYFWVALGGLAGGIFNALLAPALFTGIAEYPVALVLACLLRRPPAGARGLWPASTRDLLLRDATPAALLGISVLALAAAAPVLGLGSGAMATGLTLGAPALVCYLLLLRPIRFALALGALLFAGSHQAPSGRTEIFAKRTYYGVHRVRREDRWTGLYHGPTLHGLQHRDAARRDEPLAYYHRSGPAGSLFRALEEQGRVPHRVGVIGAGVGSLAAYGRAGQEWTFYELDPTVAFLARESGYFTFWEDSPASLRLVLGDARLSLAKEPPQPYDLLVLDAFNSDAVPAHLLTREALQLYRRRLAPGGVLAFHISNRFLDLEAVVAGLAFDAGLDAVSWADLVLSPADRDAGKLPSHWIVITQDPRLTAHLRSLGTWGTLRSNRHAVLWTDRFSNLAGVLRWKG